MNNGKDNSSGLNSDSVEQRIVFLERQVKALYDHIQTLHRVMDDHVKLMDQLSSILSRMTE